MKTTARALLAATLFLTPLLPAVAQSVPQVISYQGFVTQDDGSLLAPATPETFPVQFRIFTIAEDGVPIWAEAQNVSVFQSAFSTLLGTGEPITGLLRPPLDSISDSNLLYLEITITDGVDTKTFTPRQRLVSTPFAFRAKNASFAETASFAQTVANGSISRSKIQNGAISGAQIGGNSITGTNIADGSVTGADLQNGQIDYDKLAASLQNLLVPAGTVMAYAGTRNPSGAANTSGIPPGWIFCNGRSLSTTAYPNLFKAVSYLYGGSGSEFRVPNYVGYFLRGEGLPSNDPRNQNRLAVSNYATTNGLAATGSLQFDEFKEHNHTFAQFDQLMAADGPGSWPGGRLDNTPGEPNLVNARPIQPAGGAETRPLNRYVLYIIKAH